MLNVQHHHRAHLNNTYRKRKTQVKDEINEAILIETIDHIGMYYPAFGSSAALQLAEKYHCEWIQNVLSPVNDSSMDQSPLSSTNDHHLSTNDNDHHSRIVRQHQTIGDDDEFYLSPEKLMPSYSCSNLHQSNTSELCRQRSYSLTALDAYARLDITCDTLAQIWHSLLDLAFSEKDDFELGEYKLQHIIGLSNSYSNMNENVIEKSRSHGDIFSTSINKNSKLNSTKSKSFDVASLLKSIPNGSSNHDSANVGLLQGAAIPILKSI
jgi:hypothetical protein